MEFDDCVCIGDPFSGMWGGRDTITIGDANATFFEKAKKQWANYGYKLPQIVFWNLNATHENIPAIGEGFSYVSGFSMNMVENILSGKDGYSLMMDKLNSPRYEVIC